jgi:alkanesulfonate monooxygenase SsuD/methylene tetrahydromethanopterin reductase-like flavin-dependent oxidoreductase (luciferase family)
VWPKPLQQPLPPMYALGTSQEASDFAARNGQVAHSYKSEWKQQFFPVMNAPL